MYDTTIVSAVCASDVRAARGRASLLPSGSNTLACPAYETSEPTTVTPPAVKWGWRPSPKFIDR